MKIYWAIFLKFFLIVCAASCSSSGDVLPKSKMEKVLWDIAQSSEFLNGYVYFKHPEQNRAVLNNAMLERIFKIHGITKEQFDKTMNHYRKKPDDLKIVVDTIVARQQRLQGKVTPSLSPSTEQSLTNPVVPAQ